MGSFGLISAARCSRMVRAARSYHAEPEESKSSSVHRLAYSIVPWIRSSERHLITFRRAGRTEHTVASTRGILSSHIWTNSHGTRHAPRRRGCAVQGRDGGIGVFQPKTWADGDSFTCFGGRRWGAYLRRNIRTYSSTSREVLSALRITHVLKHNDASERSFTTRPSG